jgi:DNA helicase II / ATP-dependent DNA helicase PcrA
VDNKEYQLEQKKLNETIKHIEDQTYYVWELIENKKNQFKEQTNATGDEIAYRQGKQEAELLSKAYDEPYFGRFDIVSDEFGPETFYIGKQGVKIETKTLLLLTGECPLLLFIITLLLENRSMITAKRFYHARHVFYHCLPRNLPGYANVFTNV